MSGGHKKSKNSGFTIIEVLIVLAVTLVMFFIAGEFVNGQQSKAEFRQAINNTKTQIQQEISNVTDGNYPTSQSAITCTGGSAGAAPSVSSGTNKQGTNEGCIFLGSILEFSNPGGNPPNSSMILYTIVGNQLDSNNNTVTSIDQPGVAPIIFSSLKENEQLEYGIQPVCMQFSISAVSTCGISSPGTTPIGGFAMVIDDSIADGPQRVDIIPITGTTYQTLPGDFISDVSPPTGDLSNSISYTNPAGGIQLCFNSPDNTQSALINIGGDSGANDVTLNVIEGVGCQ